MAGRLADAAARVFEPDGPLARAVPGFEPRPSQLEMAAAVAQALDTGGTLLVEAGTGTGKTLGYLVPAILSRRRVLVSTGTKNLQEQIIFKDVPVLREALGIPFSATHMKGRGNYLCLHRFDAFRRDPSSRARAEPGQLRILTAWASSTNSGDRAEVEELPEELCFWSEIAATSENCLGSRCPRYQDCYITRMRQRAAASDLIVVNHHLLCADASVRQSPYGEVVPECAFAVIDEAHQLEDVATQYFGIAVSNYRLEELARDGDRLLATRAIRDADDGLRRAITRIRERSLEFFAELPGDRLLRPGVARVAGSEERLQITPELLADAYDSGCSLLEALDLLEGTVALIKDPPDDALSVGRRSGEIRDQLRFLLRAGDMDYVYYLELRGRGVFLKASPIDVSSIVRGFLLERMDATVLTSATLTVGGSFEYICRRLGVGAADRLALPSEFDFSTQAILYLPPAMPDPRSPAFAEAVSREVVEILRRTAGRAFVLFTSYAVLRAVLPTVQAGVAYPILVQGDAPRSVLLQQFRTQPHAVLLATASFWQGVDVVGEALSCVIVDKLPFASPGDPITAARIGSVAAAGGDPFLEYQLPLAILTLQQGLGRLLRHRQDRGVLAILDPRLRTRAYGAQILRSLPPAPMTSDIDEIGRFFDQQPRSRV
jgi:ATP-dependent DNA helicase DinG